MEHQDHCPACSGKKKHREEQTKKDLLNRLKRIEGQVRGLQNMVEQDAYCPDVLLQTRAVSAALDSFTGTLLNDHLHSCVAESIRSGSDEVIDELTDLLRKIMR